MKVSQQQQEQLKLAYKQKALSDPNASTALAKPIQKYSTKDFLYEHSTELYVIIGLSIVTGYLLCQHQANEPPMYYFSE